MTQFQGKKLTDDRMEGGQTLFYRTFTATIGGPTSTTAVKCDVGRSKNYCITVSMQKISSIHKLILKIQQILWSHELNGHVHF